MNDLIFELLQVVTMAAVVLITRYAVPWVREKIGDAKVASVAMWAEKAVLYAQQTLTSSTGTEKKAAVSEFLQEVLAEKNITMSGEQINILIESAVKAMKMGEAVT